MKSLLFLIGAASVAVTGTVVMGKVFQPNIALAVGSTLQATGAVTRPVHATGARRKPDPDILRADTIAGKARLAWTKDKDAQESERLYHEAIALTPRNKGISRDFAQTLFEQGKKQEAYTLFKSTLPRAEEGESSYFDAANLWRYVEMARAVGDDNAVRWACREIALTASSSYPAFPRFSEQELDHLPVEGLAHLAVGLSLCNSSRYKEAIAIFESVAKENPRLALAQQYIGNAHEANVGPGYTPAREAYAKAMRITAFTPKSDRVNTEVRARVQKRLKSLERPGDKTVQPVQQQNAP